jgi:PAS domain S-box-containing protein
LPEPHSGEADPTRSEELCRLVVESVEDFSIVTTDPQGLVTGWNPGAERLFGYRREEILGKPDSLLFTPEDRERHVPEQELEKARTEGKAVDERWHLRKDGSRFWGSGVTTALRDGEGRLIGFGKIGRDLTEREREREKLLEANNRLEAAIRASGQLFFDWDPASDEITFDGDAEKILGYPAKELPGGLAEAVELVHPEDRALVGAELERVRATGERFELGFRLVHKDGTVRDIWDSGCPYSGTGTSAARLVGFMRDITERKWAEELALKLAREEAARTEAEAAHRRIETILESITDAFLALDWNWRITYLNQRTARKLERIQGGSRESFLGKSLWEVVPQLAGSEFEKQGRRAMEERQPLHFEFFFAPMDTWHEVHLYPSEEGIASYSRDITERKRAEEALRVSEAKFSSIVSLAADAIVSVDEEQRIILFNRGAEQVFGYSAREVLGRPLDLLLPEGVRAVHRKHLEEFAASGVQSRRIGERGELSGRRKSGELFPADISISKVEVGRQRIYTAMLRDITASRHTQEALRQANELLAALIQGSPQAILALDLERRLQVWNPAATRIFGWREEEVLERPNPIIPEDKQEEFQRVMDAVLRGEVITGLETERVRKDGSRITVSLSAAPTRDALGRVRGVMFLDEDISERKRVEAEQRRLTAILEATPDLVGSFDTEGRLLYLNRAGRRMLGDGEEQFARWTLLDVHPEWAASLLLREGIPSAIREGTWSGETAVVRKNGQELPTSQVIIAHRQPGGAVEYLSTIARDIEERKRQEEAQHLLSEASRSFAGTLDRQTLLDSLTRLAVSRLADCCITYWVGKDGQARPVAAAHRGKDDRELLERLRALPPEGDQLILGISRVIRAGEPERVGEVTEAWLRAISRNEEHFRLLRELAFTSVMLVPLSFRKRTLGALFLASEQRERHYGPADLALAEELASRAGLAIENARLYQESQRATRARDEVLAIVSHDLRNPLSTISMSGKLLLERTPPERARERRQLEIIQRSAARMNRLIQDLLDVARMEAGHLSVERRREEVAPLVHEALELQRTLAEEKGIHLEETVEEALPVVEVDRERLLQVLQNLLSNALRFTPEGGHISLKAWRVDREVYLSVADTGPGISEESLPHLFEPFWQARRAEGAGLGLAIAKGIVEAHGGRIWVESRLGQGTTFFFTVPVSVETAPELQPLHH